MVQANSARLCHGQILKDSQKASTNRGANKRNWWPPMRYQGSRSLSLSLLAATVVTAMKLWLWHTQWDREVFAATQNCYQGCYANSWNLCNNFFSSENIPCSCWSALTVTLLGLWPWHSQGTGKHLRGLRSVTRHIMLHETLIIYLISFVIYYTSFVIHSFS